MNDSNYPSVQLLSLLRRNVPQLELCCKANYNRMILKRVIFKIFVTSRRCSTFGDVWNITSEMNDSKYSSVQLFSSLRGNVVHLQMYGTSR